MENKSKEELQKIIRALEHKLRNAQPPEPELELPDPPAPDPIADLMERLQLKEFRDSINRDRRKQGLIPFV